MALNFLFVTLALMKVALESSSLFFKNYTGIPFYIHHLFEALKDLDNVSPTLAFRLKKKWSSKNDFQKELLNQKHFWHVNNLYMTSTRFDVVHSLHTPFLNSKKGLKVATVHDLAVHLPELKQYNLTTEYFEKKRFALFRSFSKNADVLITVSEKTKKDFLRFFDFPEDRIHAVALAPSISLQNVTVKNKDFLGPKNLTPKSYFIALGGVSNRKNTLNLIKGYHLSTASKTIKLVITGKVEEPLGAKVRKYIIENNLTNNVLITGYISNAELAQLYHNAKAFLFPTLYEGFGIPILEAMSANLPVLTSTTGAASETSGGHAVLVNPFEIEDIANGLSKILNLNEKQIAVAKNYADSFSWQRTAKETVAVYNKYM
ncbi:glycosyl transferase [Croceivirga lutea]|nr:glycosyl transferase [Croceivirga lutea]